MAARPANDSVTFSTSKRVLGTGQNVLPGSLPIRIDLFLDVGKKFGNVLNFVEHRRRAVYFQKTSRIFRRGCANVRRLEGNIVNRCRTDGFRVVVFPDWRGPVSTVAGNSDTALRRTGSMDLVMYWLSTGDLLCCDYAFQMHIVKAVAPEPFRFRIAPPVPNASCPCRYRRVFQARRTPSACWMQGRFPQ